MTSLRRRAKYLVAELSSQEILVMHLGMSGSFAVTKAQRSPVPGLHDHVVFRMSSGATVTFNDPRRFGFMSLLSRDQFHAHAALGALGPEPLSAEFDGAALARTCAGKKTSLKVTLLDQRVVAGLGNIYVCEALHRAHLSPKRRASTIATRTGRALPAAIRLTAAIKKVLTEAIDRSTQWQRQASEALSDTAYFPHRFRVYDRSGNRCPTAGCRGQVKRIVQSGRSSFFCPVCQK